MPVEPAKRYRTIVADPPWDYGADGKRFAGYNRTPGKWSKRITKPIPYASMSDDAIAALPVDALGAPDSNLFLWTTQRHLPLALRIITGWGFRYRQTLIWHKSSASPLGGSVAPNDVEFLLVARRGACPITGRLPSCVVAAPQQKRHSAKPDVFLDLVEQVSPAPYVELFARSARFGWDYWGDESLGTADLASTEGEAA